MSGLNEILGIIDRPLFQFFNQTIANPVLDVFMPAFTDLNKAWWGRGLYAIGWAAIFFHGNFTKRKSDLKRGRILAVLVLLLILITDQLSSALLKNLILRPRPCWFEPGSLLIANLRLLIECGGGYSFPSTHAVNGFAVATFLSHYYRRTTPYLFTLAVLMALSRVYVGVHYPTDVMGGALVGTVAAFIFTILWKRIGERLPAVAIPDSTSDFAPAGDGR